MVPLLLLLSVTVQAITVLPSNSTQDLSASNSTHFRLQASGPLNGQRLAPLTKTLDNLNDSQKQAYHVAGNVTRVVATDSLGLSSSSIACVPCDPSDYPGPLKVDNTVQNILVSHPPPAAIVLYSSSSSHCNISANSTAEGFANIFTVTSLHASFALQALFQSTNPAVTIDEMSVPNAGVDPTSSGGSSPNTAMIILYSITGIITALFLGIIITGAVRAHRHPERYGPRRVAGRPRQSRARGIARAMLETIPIVKFGDEPADGVDGAKRDIEMEGSEAPSREHSPPRSENAEIEQLPNPADAELPKQPATPTPESKGETTHDTGNFSCPICTDDFIKGQDLRVLPCNHQFHPECIDPWLVNVSGTCPLCRIDLNPSKADENTEEGEIAEHPEETAEETAAETPARHSHHRLKSYLNVRRMRNATVEERLAALRQVREANQDEQAATEDATAQRSRNRLSARLRDRFRIRTSAHGLEPPPVSPIGGPQFWGT
ncbi:hypothetical protein N7470_001119 [Penicillium chermesinum]|nr:hypothetical protein N7470_001119 [Penicillium chermesinum]